MMPRENRLNGGGSSNQDNRESEETEKMDDDAVMDRPGRADPRPGAGSPNRTDRIRSDVAEKTGASASEVRVSTDQREIRSDRVALTARANQRPETTVALTDKGRRQAAAEQSERFETDDLEVNNGRVEVRESAIGAGGQIDYRFQDEFDVDDPDFRSDTLPRRAGESIRDAGAAAGGSLGSLGGSTAETVGSSAGRTVAALPAAALTLPEEGRQVTDFVGGDAVSTAPPEINPSGVATEAAAFADDDQEDALDRATQVGAQYGDTAITGVDRNIDFSLSGLEVQDGPVPVSPSNIAEAATTFEADEEFEQRRAGQALGGVATAGITAGAGKIAGSAARLSRASRSRRSRSLLADERAQFDPPNRRRSDSEDKPDEQQQIMKEKEEQESAFPEQRQKQLEAEDIDIKSRSKSFVEERIEQRSSRSQQQKRRELSQPTRQIGDESRIRASRRRQLLELGEARKLPSRNRSGKSKTKDQSKTSERTRFDNGIEEPVPAVTSKTDDVEPSSTAVSDLDSPTATIEQERTASVGIDDRLATDTALPPESEATTTSAVQTPAIDPTTTKVVTDSQTYAVSGLGGPGSGTSDPDFPDLEFDDIGSQLSEDDEIDDERFITNVPNPIDVAFGDTR